MGEEEEEDDGTPLWKKALMRKRAAEQKKKDAELERKVYTAELGRVNAPSTSWGLQRMLTPGIIYKLGLSTLNTTHVRY